MMESSGAGNGTLYVCGTPIGNLEDLSVRVTRLLGEVSVIAAEDTRHTRKLLNHLSINTKLTSYHEHNKTFKGPELLERLLQGEDIALVSDAGMPGISDPGYEMIRLCIDNGVVVVPIPGPTAFVTALVLSGLPTESFYYGGFIPRSAKEIRTSLKPLAGLKSTLVFYEAPHRVGKSLPVIMEVFGDRQAALCRELTKKFEEAIRGRITDIISHLKETPARGELTLVIGPPDPGSMDSGVDGGDSGGQGPQGRTVEDIVRDKLAQGATDKEAVKMAVKELGVSKNEAYRVMLELKRRSEG